MSASIDFSEIREMTIAFSGLSHMDNEYNSRVIVGGTYIEQYNSVINGGLYVPCCRLSCIASLR